MRYAMCVRVSFAGRCGLGHSPSACVILNVRRALVVAIGSCVNCRACTSLSGGDDRCWQKLDTPAYVKASVLMYDSLKVCPEVSFL